MTNIKKFRDDAYRHQGGLCFYCGQGMAPADAKGPLRCTAEHLVARRDGGRDTKHNIVAACWWCNSRRHARKVPLEPAALSALVTVKMTEGRWYSQKT